MKLLAVVVLAILVWWVLRRPRDVSEEEPFSILVDPYLESPWEGAA